MNNVEERVEIIQVSLSKGGQTPDAKDTLLVAATSATISVTFRIGLEDADQIVVGDMWKVSLQKIPALTPRIGE